MSPTMRAPRGAARAVLLAALALAAAALAALTFNPPRAEAAFTTGQCLGADITGRGASFARDANLVFTQQFQGTFCQAAGTAPGITYDPAGSGAGRRSVGERGSSVSQNQDGAMSRLPAGPRFGMTDEAPSTTSVAQINMGTDAVGDEDRIHVIPAAVGAAPPLVNFPDNCDVSLLSDAAGTGQRTPDQNLDGDMTGDDVSRVRFTKAQLDAIFARDPASDNWTEVFPALAPDADCNKPIIRVVRFDDSGTTFVFKDYLDRANPTRNWVPGFTDAPTSRTREWPNAAFGARADCAGAMGPGSAGDANGSIDQLTSSCTANAANLVAKLIEVDGSIGYADLSTARAGGLAITPEANDNDTYWTQVQNGAGGTNGSGPLAGNQFTEPSANANSFRTVDGGGNPVPRGANCQNTQFENVPTSTFGDFVPTSGVNSPNGFGVCALTYGLLFDDYKEAYGLLTDQAGEERKARTVKDYWTSIVSDAGQAVLFPQDYAPLPPGVLGIARTGVDSVSFDKASEGGGNPTPPVVNPPVVNPPVVTPPVAPSNRFSVVRFTTRSRAGTGQFRVKVPGRGTLVLAAGTRSRGKRVKVDGVRLTFSRAGTYSLNIKPGRAAKRLLRRSGRLRLNVRITFTPRGGRARSVRRTVTLRLTRSVRR